MSRDNGLLLMLGLLGLGAGWWLGAEHVQAEWDAAQLQAERAVQVLGAQERRRQAVEADKFEAARAALRARAPTLLPELQNELQGPIPCVGEASAPLASLPIPAGAVDRLRRAGADPGSD